METSYLLAGTPVIAYADGKQVNAKPVSQPLTVDFGKGLGRKTVWLYNLPEVESAFKYMKVPNVSARFGTDPGKQMPVQLLSLLCMGLSRCLFVRSCMHACMQWTTWQAQKLLVDLSGMFCVAKCAGQDKCARYQKED